MVAVAQLVEPRLVVPVVAGSSPVSHPIVCAGEGEFIALTCCHGSLGLVCLHCSDSTTADPLMQLGAVGRRVSHSPSRRRRRGRFAPGNRA